MWLKLILACGKLRMEKKFAKFQVVATAIWKLTSPECSDMATYHWMLCSDCLRWSLRAELQTWFLAVFYELRKILRPASWPLESNGNVQFLSRYRFIKRPCASCSSCFLWQQHGQAWGTVHCSAPTAGHVEVSHSRDLPSHHWQPDKGVTTGSALHCKQGDWPYPRTPVLGARALPQGWRVRRSYASVPQDWTLSNLCCSLLWTRRKPRGKSRR